MCNWGWCFSSGRSHRRSGSLRVQLDLAQDRGDFEDLKYGQELAKAVWVGIATVLITLILGHSGKAAPPADICSRLAPYRMTQLGVGVLRALYSERGGGMRAASWITVWGLTLALATAAQAQSLGDAARREKERRQHSPSPPARVYTDDDLKAMRPAGVAGEPAVEPSPTVSPDASPSPEAPDPKRDKALRLRWRERFAEARARVSEAEARAWVTRVEVVFVSSVPVQQQVRRFEETQALRDARQALADLEEEYRRTGLPPGWVRE